MDSSRKRGSSRSALDSRKSAKRVRTEKSEDNGFTDGQNFMIAQTASACMVSPEGLAAAIATLQKPLRSKLPISRRGSSRPDSKTKMPCELDEPDEKTQRSYAEELKNPEDIICHSTGTGMPDSWQASGYEQGSSTETNNCISDNCFGFKLTPSVWADCFANLIPYDQISSYEQVSNYEQAQGITCQNTLVPYNNNTTVHTVKNHQILPKSINPHTESLLNQDPYEKLLQLQQPFACDPFQMDPYMQFSLPHYVPLQATQPMNSYSEMAYPNIDSGLPSYSNINDGIENESYYSEGLLSSESEKSHFLGAADDIHHRSSVSAEPEETHSPIRPKVPRSTVDRVQTAQTRQLAACVRCKMQRIRCVPDPVDPKGVCLTCKKVSKLKFSKILCLRYRITDARLFKQGYLPGQVWTTRFQTMELNDIDNWSSPEEKTIQITYDYSPRPLTLQVREFRPHEGDMLHRSWKHGSVKKSVLLPPFAIASFEAAEKIYEDYINQEGPQFFASTIDEKNTLLWVTMSAAIKASNQAMTEPERILLKMVLRLWVAGRFICRSERICGPETLGLPSNLIDETNPWLHGKIPIPPVMGAQIDLIIISRILAPLRAAILEKLQKIILANKPQNWFCIYLCIFVLLHNCALMTQQDTAYAKKHGLKTRFALIDLIEELHMGANILLAYFHYCTKGFRPFSMDWDAEQTLSMAELNAEQVEFVKKTAVHVKANESRFSGMFKQEHYDDDLYFVAQMYEEDWKPRATKLDSPAQSKQI